MNLNDLFPQEIEWIESALKTYLEQRFPLSNEGTTSQELKKFHQALHYGTFSGGKRFRPLLSVLTAQALKKDPSVVRGVALAVEMVHSYSLIHDDLPSMDDDKERRGQPTLHVRFNESLALLAGDTLLTEAFGAVTEGLSERPQSVAPIVQLLVSKSGGSGMVAGQVLDLAALEKGATSTEALDEIHRLKTGALIEFAVQAAAMACEAASEDIENLKSYSQHLGRAFQLADDIEDFDPENPEGSGYPGFLGLETTQQELTRVSDQALTCLDGFGESAEGLRTLVRFNRDRVDGRFAS